MSGEPRREPETTREFVALWNDAVEEHLVRQLVQSLPALARDLTLSDPAHAAVLARPLVRALRLSAMTGDASAALRYLADAAGTARGGPESGSAP